jgi:hypothetical protein
VVSLISRIMMISTVAVQARVGGLLLSLVVGGWTSPACQLGSIRSIAGY